jgi:drug/metabolite transporter (DMT)-like permease
LAHASSAAATRLWPAALAAVSGSVMVGVMPLVTLRLYAEGISAPSMLVWRYGIALVPLAAVAVATRHNLWAALRGGAWRITLVGATLGAGQTLCFWESLHTLDTSVAILLFYVYPALTLAIDRLFFKRPIRPHALLCVGVILLGAGLVTLPDVTNGNLDPGGLLWLLPSPVIYAFYLAASAVLLRRQPPVVGAGFLYLGLALVFLVAGTVLGIEVPTTPDAWLLIVFIALGPGALTVTLFSYSVPRLGASSYAIIANTELLTVVAIGVLWLGEALTPARATGGTLIVAGIMTHALARQKAPRPNPHPAIPGSSTGREMEKSPGLAARPLSPLTGRGAG